MKLFGNYLKSLRESKGMTLREVEKETGISNAYLSQLEKDKVRQPSPTHLYKLAGIYDVSYEILMEKVGYPVPKTAKKIKEVSPFERIGKLTDLEEEALLNYLAFIRKQNLK